MNLADASEIQCIEVHSHLLRQHRAAQVAGRHKCREAHGVGAHRTELQQHVAAHLGRVAVAVDDHHHFAAGAQSAVGERQVGDLVAAGAGGLLRRGAVVLDGIAHRCGHGLAQLQRAERERRVLRHRRQRELAGSGVHRHVDRAVGFDQRFELAQHIGPARARGQTRGHARLHRVGVCGATAGDAEAVLVAQAQLAWERDGADLCHGRTRGGHWRGAAGLCARAGRVGAGLGHGGEAGAQAVAARNRAHFQLGAVAAHGGVAQDQRRQGDAAGAAVPRTVAHFHAVGKQVGRLLVVSGVVDGARDLEGLVHRVGGEREAAVGGVDAHRLGQHARLTGFDLGFQRREDAVPVVAGRGAHAVLAVVDLHRIHVALGHRVGHAAGGAEGLVDGVGFQHELARTRHHRGGGGAGVNLALQTAQDRGPGAASHHGGAVAVGADVHGVHVAQGQLALVEHQTGDLLGAGAMALGRNDPGLAVKAQAADLRHRRRSGVHGGVAGHQLLQRLPLVHTAFGVHRHHTAGFERTHGGAGFDAVDEQVGRRFDDDVVAIGHVAHVAHVQVVTGNHLDAAIVGHQAVDHQIGGLVHQHVAAATGVQRQGVDQGVDLHRALGVHHQVFGDEDRRTVGADGRGLDRQQTAAGVASGGVGGHDAALQAERTFHPQGDVLRGLETAQTAHKTGQTPVAHGGTGFGEVDVDVAQGADLEVLRRQIVGLHIDEAGGRDHRGLVEVVGEVAVAVEVDTGCGFGERVGGVTVVVEVEGFFHTAAAASDQHHLLNGRAWGGAAAVVAGLDGDGAGQDQVLARHQLQVAVGRQAA